MFKTIVLLSCLATVAMVTSTKLRTEDHTRLTGEQRAALDELMRRVLPKIKEDWVKDELYILKFLRAKNFNVDDAELYFLAHLSWRDDNRMRSILTEDFSDMKKDYPYKLDGYDKQGRPLLITDFGEWDLDRAAERGEIDRVLRYYDRMLEEAEQKVLDLQHQGKNITQFTWLMNQDNKATVSFAIARCYWHSANTYEKQHPGASSRVVFINSPSLFSPAMSAMRPLLSQETNDIFDNYGDEKEWKPILLDLVDPEQLPPSYGGTKGGKPKVLVGTFQGDMNKPGTWSWPKLFGFRQ
ncbi:SEC14-like protein 2 [Folsomia candida]|uniref:CRAL-TRIO domain-containing protein n=1 Tax=Folsomia candida TaxID=158441 RepID=A0A226D4S7_FOLCA|nr:SEC14-like protein 2 [Folsomia candida]OXA39747.1 hypothetical protein Fcan01_25519 [Folsomia candida]